MAVKVWRGDAQGVAQVTHVTPKIVEVGDQFTLTCNHKSITVTAAAATPQDVIDQFVTALTNTAIPEFTEFTVTSGTDASGAACLVLTGASSGKPFTVTTSSGQGDLGVLVSTTIDGAAGQNEDQRVTIAGVATGGTFTLTFDGQTTGAIAYNASAATVQTALEALSNISSGDVAVTGNAGGPWTVEFKGQYAGSNVALMTGNGSSITKAGGAYTVQLQTLAQGDAGLNEIQQVGISSEASGGTFTLTFDGQTTGAIAYNASAATLQTALEALSNISSGDVAVTGSRPWLVEFKGQYLNTNVAQLTGDGASLTGCGEIGVTTLTEGQPLTDEIQWVKLGGGLVVWQLTFTNHLGVSGITASMSPEATAAVVQSNLEAIASVGTGNVIVTDGPRQAPLNTRSYYVRFVGELGGIVQLLMTGTTVPSGTVPISETQAGGQAAVNEEQQISVSIATGGTFTLSFRGQTTGNIAYDAPAATVDTALEALSTIGSGDVSVTKVSYPGVIVYTVEFTGSLAGEDVPAITADPANLTGGSAGTHDYQVATSAVNEQQQARIFGSPAGGTFTLTFDGQTTAGVAYNAATSAVESALEALSNIDDVEVTGITGGPWVVEFRGTNAASDVPQMTGDGSSLSGADIDVVTSQIASAAIDEIQQVSTTGSPSGGTFTLTYSGQTTAPIPWDAAVMQVQVELEALSNIDPGDVAVSGNPGGAWAVLFQGQLAGTNVVTMTGDGSNLTGQGTQTFVVAEYISPTGPNWFSEDDNWSTLSVPVDGDDIIFEEITTSCLYGLDQASITPNSIVIKQSYTGYIGLANYNGSYYEYRPTYLRLGDPADASTVTIKVGEGEGYGSQMIKLDTGGCQTDLLVMDTGIPLGTEPALIWKGTHASNVVRIYKGYFGAAVFRGETGDIDQLAVGYRENQTSDADVTIGDGCSLGTVNQLGGTIVVGGESGTAITAITMLAGELTINGTDGVNQLIMRGGTCYYNTTGTLGGNTVLAEEAILDLRQDMRTKTITNPIEVYGKQADIYDPFKLVSGLVIDYNETTRNENLGIHLRLTRGVPS